VKALVVFNHPYDGSYCSAVLQSVLTGLKKTNHELDLIHLDREKFNPVMTTEDLEGYSKGIVSDPKVLDYQRRINEADHLIIIFPIWWELMPAMTKGFIDKVMTKGFAFEVDMNRMPPKITNKLKRLKDVTMITTMDTPALVYRILFGNAIKKSLITGTFRKMGLKKTRWINLSKVKWSSKNERERWLRDIENYCSRLA